MDDRKVVFISYWTPPYQKAAMRLKASLDKLGLASDINEIPDKGWQANVRHKPTYILEMLRKHEDAYAVVWIDADGDVVQKPELFWQIEDDLAVRFLHWQAKDVDELLSGTVFARRTDNMLKAMEAWIKELAVAPQNLSCPEQRTLQNMLPTLPITVNRLPEPYCRILKDRGRHGVPADSVIVHYQFSREVRYGRTPAAHLSDPTKVGNTRMELSQPKKIEERHKRPERARVDIKKVKKPERPKAPRIPDSFKASIRRSKIIALRKQILVAEREKIAAAHAVRMAAGMRNRREKLEALETRLYRSPQDLYVGGVRGHPASPKQIAFAQLNIAGMTCASELDGCVEGRTVIVMGNSPTLAEIPAEIYNKYPRVGCNRGLRYKDVWPTFLVIADREPYCQERDSGRLQKAAEQGVKLLLSDSIFDPAVELRGPYEDVNRRGQPVPTFECYRYRIGPRKKNWDYRDVARGAVRLPVNTTTFEAPVVSCLNVAGSMLQAAAILGAKRIVCIGIEMRWESNEQSHFFGPGGRVGAYPQDGSIDLIQAALRFVKKAAEGAGIEIINVSPITDSPFARVFGSYPTNKFIAESADLPPFVLGSRMEIKEDEEISHPVLNTAVNVNPVPEEADPQV